jgi:hypothetical protein
MTRRQQENARKLLCQKRLIEEKLRGVPAKLYFRARFDELELALRDEQEEHSVLLPECPFELARSEPAIW